MKRLLLLGALIWSSVNLRAQSDSLELVDLYNSTEGAAWFTKWDLNSPMSTWHGVTVNVDNRVTSLILVNNNLKGSLPNLNLPELLDFALRGNTLRDTLPSLSFMRKLQFLDLSNNELDGQLHDFNMPDLGSLRLDNNKLSGTLPPFTHLRDLQTLLLSNNRLTGGLPDFNTMPNLATLRLADNQLEGFIPEFNFLPNLLVLDLGNNNFFGSLPAFRGSTSLFIIDVSDNDLNGFLPSFSRLSLLNDLYVQGNRLVGDVPNLSALQDLQVLDISDNFLGGSLPDLTANVDLQEFYAAGNDFEGNIPSFAGLGLLQRIDLSRNQLGDTIPDLSYLTNLEDLRLDSNNFSHSLLDATAFGTLSVLRVQNNQLTFGDLFDINGTGLTQFVYAPQKKIMMPDTIIATIGDNVTIDLVEDRNVPNNTFSWYLNDDFIVATAINRYNLLNINGLDEGIYHCIVNNNSLPALSLFSEEVRLIMRCPINEVNVVDTICAGDTLRVNGVNYTSSGMYRDTVLVPDPGTCDSVFIIDLTVRPTFDTSLVDTICESDQLLFGDQILTESGTYVDTLASVAGCDSIVTLALTVRPSFTSVREIELCSGDTLFVGPFAHTAAGIYFDTLQTIHGCDSVIISDLTVIDTFLSVTDTTLCFGEMVMWRGEVYDETGIYVDSFMTSTGCDSLFVLDLTVQETDSFFVEQIICRGDSIVIGGTAYFEPGVYVDSLMTLAGCDSFVFLRLDVVDDFNQEFNYTFCEGDTLFFGDDTITTAGIYIDSLTAQGGCDSIIKARVNFVDFWSRTIDTVLCFGDSLRVANNIYKVSGIFRDTLFNANGCDTLVVSRINVTDPIELEGARLLLNSQNVGSIEPTITGGFDFLFYRWNTGDSTLLLDSVPAGVYQLTVTDDAGCSEVFEFTLDPTTSASEGHHLDATLTLSPNPVSPQQPLHLTLKTQESGLYQLALFDVVGRRLYAASWDVRTPEATRQLVGWQRQPGYYLLRLRNAQGDYLVKKIVVQ